MTAYEVEIEATSHLTDRQIEILRLFANGDSYLEIAQRLQIRFPTINHHSVNIRKRLGAKNTANAVYLAMQNGLIR